MAVPSALQLLLPFIDDKFALDSYALGPAYKQWNRAICQRQLWLGQFLPHALQDLMTRLTNLACHSYLERTADKMRDCTRFWISDEAHPIVERMLEEWGLPQVWFSTRCNRARYQYRTLSSWITKKCASCGEDFIKKRDSDSWGG